MQKLILAALAVCSVFSSSSFQINYHQSNKNEESFLLKPQAKKRIVDSEMTLSEEQGIGLFVQFNIPELARLTETNPGETLAERQADLESFRLQNQNYFREHMVRICDSIGLEDFVYSSYSPFASKIYHDVNLYLIDIDAIETATNDILDYWTEVIDLNNNDVRLPAPDTTADVTNDTVSVTFDQVKEMHGITNDGYKGNSIKIGIIDGEGVFSDKNFDNPEGRVHHLRPANDHRLSNSVGDHARRIAEMIAGKSGIVRQSSIYHYDTANLINPYYFTTAMDSMVNSGVNILNLSVTAGDNYYSYQSRYIDWLSRYYGIAVFVAAGNDRDRRGKHLVSSFARTINAISVGSVDINRQISSFSCYNTECEGLSSSAGERLTKPNVVAYGEHFEDPNVSCGDEIGSQALGTSFATPIAVGIAAKLMERFPSLLVGHPQRLQAILNASTTRGRTQALTCDEKYGFGIINYEKAVSFIESAERQEMSYSGSGFVVFSHSFTLDLDETFTASLSVFTLGSSDLGNKSPGDRVEPRYTLFGVSLEDDCDNQLMSGTLDSNCSVVKFVNYDDDDLTFTITITVSVELDSAMKNFVIFYGDNL